MSKYKVLKSVAHNLGHSFLSDMNAAEPRYTIVPELLYQSAKKLGLAHVRIDFKAGTIEPEDLRSRQIDRAIDNYRRALPDLIASQGVDPESVREAQMEIWFDFSQPLTSRHELDVEIPISKLV